MARALLDNPEIYGRLRDFNSERPAHAPQVRDSQMCSPARQRQPAAPAVAMPIKQETVQMPSAVEQKSIKTQKFRRLKDWRWLSDWKMTPKIYFAMAALVFSVGVIVSLNQLKVTSDVHAQTTHHQSSVQSSAQPPDETAPSTNYKSYYSVPPDNPKFLDIDKISVSARIRKLDVDSNSTLQAPTNIYDAGWYEESAKPGDAGGAILLDGHVSGPTKHGVFYELKNLQAGDLIRLTRGDNQVFNFQVVKTKAFDDGSVDMASTLTSVTPGKLGLNLMTCTGKFDAKSNQYQQRLVVYAVAI